MSLSVKGDAFPSIYSPKVIPLRHPTTMSGFREIIANHRVSPIICYKQNEKLYYELMDMNRRFIQNFIRTGTESSDFPNDYDPSVPWTNVERRLRRDIRRGLRNTDSRVFFKYGNVFLVKYGFTFGHRCVEPGTFHIYQTTKVPLLLYEVKWDRLGQVNQEIRSLRIEQQYCYKKYVLQPDGRYKISPGTRYVLMAERPTLFSVDVVDKPMDHLSYRDYRVERETHQYDIPPMTPALDYLEMVAVLGNRQNAATPVYNNSADGIPTSTSPVPEAPVDSTPQ